MRPPHGWDFKLQFPGLPLTILGYKHIINLHTKVQPWFFFKLLQCCLFYLVSHRILLDLGLGCGDAGQTLRSSRIPDPPPFFLIYSAAWLVFADRHRIQAVSRPIRSKSEPALLLLKPKQDFLHFNFPNNKKSPMDLNFLIVKVL